MVWNKWNKQRHSLKFKRPCLQHWPKYPLCYFISLMFLILKYRCFCELARQIGFHQQATSIFEIQQMLTMYRHLVRFYLYHYDRLYYTTTYHAPGSACQVLYTCLKCLVLAWQKISNTIKYQVVEKFLTLTWQDSRLQSVSPGNIVKPLKTLSELLLWMKCNIFS